MLPGVWPGVCSTSAAIEPARSTSPFVGGHVDARILRRLHPQPGGLYRKLIAQESIRLMHVDRRSGQSAQFLRAADMIDMRVRDYNHFHREPVLCDRRQRSCRSRRRDRSR